tara:strand:+ start:4736 stop:4981 length:246 start_codon:yes stop_codon:yes gene_type:complete
MAHSLTRYIVLGLGWYIVVFGVLGIFLPVLQGILFLLTGLILLSRESACAQRQLEKLQPAIQNSLKNTTKPRPAPSAFGKK